MSDDWRSAPVVHGVDGCPGGWAVVTVAAEGDPKPTFNFTADLDPLIGRAAIAIDIPIGLPDRILGPGRGAEQTVRPLLGKRAASVFSIPSRAAVFAPSWDAACAMALAASEPARKPTIQGFNIFAKIRMVDALLTPANQESVFECHAEVAFWRLNGERPMATGKAVRGVPARDALKSRIDVLAAHGVPPEFFAGRAAAPLVDRVDAAAIALIARRCRAGTATPFPDPPEVDGRGLRAAIWA
ncbi:MAG: DUF429 domain-containing protein [Pseudomonadota bacterium]